MLSRAFQRTVRNAARALVAGACVVGLGSAGVQTARAEAADLVDEMVASVNQVRAEAGLPPLAENGSLHEIAFERSADMAARDYFSHTSPDGVTVFTLLDQRGLGFRAAGENCAFNFGGEDQAARIAVEGFVNSPPHRANLLNPGYSQIGVGVASDGAKIYFTLVFLG